MRCDEYSLLDFTGDVYGPGEHLRSVELDRSMGDDRPGERKTTGRATFSLFLEQKPFFRATAAVSRAVPGGKALKEIKYPYDLTNSEFCGGGFSFRCCWDGTALNANWSGD